MVSQVLHAGMFFFCGEIESVLRKIRMQETEMLANPKERSDDTVVYPVILSTLYLATTPLKPPSFKRSPNSSSYRNNGKFTKEEHE